MRKVASREVHKDNSPLFTGTHKGSDGSASLYDPGAMFKPLGCNPDLELWVENETQGTGGHLSYADNDYVRTGSVLGDVFPMEFPTAWNNGDTYNIYKTSTKNSMISDTWVDVSRGWKINDKKDVGNDGWRNEDRDLDDHRRYKVFGPNQPEHN